MVDWAALRQNVTAVLPASLVARISSVLPKDTSSLTGVNIPVLAGPLVLALLVLARAGIVGARASKMEYTVQWNRERCARPLLAVPCTQ
jgi:hypothetical protein